MDKSEILAIIKEIPTCFLATVDGNQARVRGMEKFRADEDGIILYTSKVKDVYQQVAKNPDVEICFLSDKGGMQIRVSGKMETVEDTGIKEELISARPFLKPIVEKVGYDGLAILRLKNGKATTWTMKDMALPKTFIDL